MSGLEMQSTSYPPRSSLVGVVLAITICLFSLPVHFGLALQQRGDLVDDAYISARFARNLVDGRGLTYNRGPQAGPPVEGYTNFLWTTIIATGLNEGIEPEQMTQWVGLAANLLCIIIAMFAVYFSAKEHRWAAPAVGFTLALNLPFAIWAGQGLETSLFAMLAVVALVGYGDGSRVRITANLAALLAAMTRPDGILIFGAMVLARLLILSRAKQWPKRSDYFNAALFVIPYYAYFLWRFGYYDSFFPNTFYARVGLGAAGLGEGLRYVLSFFRAEGLGMIALLVLGGLGLLKGRRDALLAPVLFVLSYLVFIVWVGGDFMPDGRFMVHLLGVMVVVLWIGLTDFEKALTERLGDRFPHHGVTAVLLVAIVALSSIRMIRYESEPSFEKEWHRHQAQWYMPVTDCIKNHVWQSETIALGDIGYVGYYADIDRILDTHGLVDPHLARLAGIASLNTDLDYVLDQQPRFIVSMIHKYPTGDIIGHTAFDRALAESERRDREYRFFRSIPGWHSRELSRDDMQTRDTSFLHLISAHLWRDTPSANGAGGWTMPGGSLVFVFWDKIQHDIPDIDTGNARNCYIIA